MLHHGSIKLGSSALEGDIATLETHRRGVLPADFAPALREAFQEEFAVVLEASVPERDERELARELGARYLAREFVHSR